MKKGIAIIMFCLLGFWANAQRNEQQRNDTKITIVEPTKGDFTRTPEVMPGYPGGQDSLLAYFFSIPYSSNPEVNTLAGTAYIEYVVNKEGYVEQVKVILSSDHEALDNLAKKHIEAMPRWTPGSTNGMPVNVQMTMPFKFKPK